jgi:hypothetical protein
MPLRSCNFSLDPVQYPAIEAGYIVDTWRSESYFDGSSTTIERCPLARTVLRWGFAL